MEDSNIYKLNLQFVHDNETIDILLDAAKPDSTKKITIAGKEYTIKEDAKTPEIVKNVLKILRENQIFQSENEFLREISKKTNINEMSLTKRIYSFQDRFVDMTNIDTTQIKQSKNELVEKLLNCNPNDTNAIKNIINVATLPINKTKALFEIADVIEMKHQNAELTQAIRKLVRPFDLEQTMNTISKLIEANYLDEAQSLEISQKFQELFHSGRYNKFYDPKEFAFELTLDLRAEGRDEHFEILYRPSPDEIAETGKVESRTKDGIGYFEITKLEHTNNPDSMLKVKTALDDLCKSQPQAIIIDLRENSGGSGRMMKYIVSHFLEPDIPLASFQYRCAMEDSEAFPTEPFVTLSKKELPLQERILNKPIYILTSPDTMSAAESLAYHLREHANAKLIGDKTRGGVHVTKLFDVNEDFYVAIPIGDYILESKKESWEGKGILPDTKVDPKDAQEVAEKEIRKRLS